MKTKSSILIAFIVMSVALVIPGTALSEMTTIEGKIGGANCILDKKICTMTADDPYVALEVDFILTDANGKHYFLPNLSRSLKTSLLNKNLRITGDLHGISMVASVIKEKTGESYLEIWNWKKIAKQMTRGN
jgi:hypothetical protein